MTFPSSRARSVGLRQCGAAEPLVEAIAVDIEKILARGRGGRPPRGAAAGTVESVRLDPDLKHELLLRAARDHTSVSNIIRRAIGEYLHAS